MEAANVVFVPGLALALGVPRDLIEAVAIGLAMVASAGFLIVGAAYWRGVDRRLRFRDRVSLERALRLADRAEWPLLLTGGGAIVATLLALPSQGWSSAVIASALLALLASLEYINYYHRQLQHFDNRDDLKRLLTGRGFRPSHMARDLSAWRKQRLSAVRIAT
ncbi:MAG: hypothetical protein M3Q83_04970 [Pseudomonadota bacterium]|nr:hypothetical protein [Pseudomonadota bacterium]